MRSSPQLDHVPSALELGGAALAAPNLLLHRRVQDRVDFAFEIVGNLAPNLFTADYHGFVPFANHQDRLYHIQTP